MLKGTRLIGARDQIARASSFEDAHAGHRWQLPARYNISTDCVSRWATDAMWRSRPALIWHKADDSLETFTWAEIEQRINRMANGLISRLGIQPGDVVAVMLPQRPETAIIHMAIYRVGAILLPLSKLYAGDALQYRIVHASAKAIVVDEESLPTIDDVRAGVDTVQNIMVVGDGPSEHLRWSDVEEAGSPVFEAADTTPNTPALLSYTSGTTGTPKGCLHGHRVALGHANLSYVLDYFQEDDVYYSHADWSWLAGIGNGILGPWGFGVPIVASTPRFDPAHLVRLIDRTNVTVGLYTPTVLRLVRQAGETPKRLLRCVVSGAELVTPEITEWAAVSFADSFNIGFGQTEANDVIGCVSMWETPPVETLGRALPGHDVAIMDDQDHPVEVGEIGEICIRADNDPVQLLEYFRSPEATAEKFRSGWLHTGDLGYADDRGYLAFSGRTDDMIKASGYRISPGEVEAAILRLDEVVECAVVGVADADRGQVVKAFVQVEDGVNTDSLADRVRTSVRAGVGKHAYPRQVEFVSEFPRTATGKIRRAELRGR